VLIAIDPLRLPVLPGEKITLNLQFELAASDEPQSLV
jgi:hypothetical protein